MERTGYWLRAMRAPFLSLPVALVFLGTAVAISEGAFQLWRAGLALAGLILLQSSLMFLNDYSDFHTGIDYHTSPTPFTGGSGMLREGMIEPGYLHAAGIACLVIGSGILMILVYLIDVWLFPFLPVGVFAVISYTEFLQRKALGEIFAGLALGLLPVIGSTFIQTESYSAACLAAGIVSAILAFNLLLLFEFPDLEADILGGRKNLLVVLGQRAAGRLYSVLMSLMYVGIVLAVAVKIFPIHCLVSFITMPIAWKPIKWAWTKAGTCEITVGVLAANFATNLTTVTLLGVGFLAAVSAS
jgi:1,4-dihydroxy-2-naphthoate octaprenyltransferase